MVSEMDEKLIYGKLHIHPISREVYVDEREIVLTRMEFDVLYFLAYNPNRAFTKDQIYEAVCKESYADGSYIIRDIIYRLRAKLDISHIHTLHGYGYKFNAES